MTIRVFISGQSNSLGRGTGGPSFTGVDSRVRVWDNANPLGANGTAWRTAALAQSTYETFQFTDRNNFGVWFCHKMAQTLNDDVDMTMVSRGGTTIDAWAPGATVPMLQECLDVWSATGQAPAHVFLWHQGEGNVNTPNATSYKTQFLNLVANLKTGGVIDNDTIIILGGTAEENSDRINFNITRLQALAEENAQIYYAPSDGLPTYDGTHFTGDALYAFGVQSYFAAYLQAEGLGMADIWTIVNEGGTPGTPGSGTNKIFNLKSLRAIGMGSKDTTLAPDFAGFPPGDKLLTAAMLASGAVVEYGSGVNGRFWRWESGLQVCAIDALATRTAASNLRYTWTYPVAFADQPHVIASSSGVGAVNMSFAKKGGSIIDHTTPFVDSVILRYLSDDLYTDGDEALGVTAIAIGLWK